MEPSVAAVQLRARRAYEGARLLRAAWGSLPIAVLVGAAVLLASEPGPTVALGALLLLGAVGCLWFGQGLQRGLLPGVLAGLLPLTAVSCAARFGHLCTGTACRTVCLTTSIVGGVAAGLVIGSWALRRAVPVALWATASAAALLTGAMGCSCAGLAGLQGLGLGFLAAVPFFVADVLRRRAGAAPPGAAGPREPHP